MTISGEQIREAALSHEKTCPAAMKDSFCFGFREGAKWMQHELDHLIEGEMESGELLAYNCEKRARQEIIDKTIKWLEAHLPYYCDEFDETYTAEAIRDFREVMTKEE